MTSKRILVPFAILALAACTVTEKAPTDTATVAAPESPAVVPADSTPAVDPAPAPPASPVSSWVVNTRGIGPITAGMTVAKANAASGNALDIPAKMEECDFVKVKGATDLIMMVEKGTISRVDVARSSTIATTTGAKIGDTEDRIKSLYPGVATQPHKYTDGHYLVVTPAAAADKNFRIVFETDGAKVLRYRSGRVPAVEYVEGCS